MFRGVEIPAKPGIYALGHAKLKGIYIGYATDLARQMAEHVETLRLQTHHNAILQFIANCHGVEDLTVTILEISPTTDTSYLTAREQFFMDTFRGGTVNSVRVVASGYGAPLRPPTPAQDVSTHAIPEHLLPVPAQAALPPSGYANEHELPWRQVPGVPAASPATYTAPRRGYEGSTQPLQAAPRLFVKQRAEEQASQAAQPAYARNLSSAPGQWEWDGTEIYGASLVVLMIVAVVASCSAIGYLGVTRPTTDWKVTCGPTKTFVEECYDRCHVSNNRQAWCMQDRYYDTPWWPG